MDNQNNLPKLRNICDDELRPLTVHVDASSEEVERRPSSMNEMGPSDSTQTPSDILYEFRHELTNLTGMFKDFINYSISKDRPTSEQNRSPRKRSYDEVSVCQTHDSFEHNYMSHSQCYSGAISPAGNVDALSSKHSKSEQRLDLESLFRQKQSNSANSEGSVSPLNMEDEVLGHVENELPDIISEEKGQALASEKLATKIESYWKNPSSKSVVKVFNRHKQPKNLENLMVPPMPKVIRQMPSFKDLVSSREKKLYNVEQAVVKSAHIMSSIADDVMTAETKINNLIQKL